ncbi:mutS like protein [Planoprotostelium fungivorum]|uniref:MutS like protein n=1 Tax=Planoprotostelium fungivorum TaxID=1890364 RepID=A0A2P6NDJ7_9EUKA|nr:mutS like protein [Planoprotostelium fungivorum]
MSQHGIADKTNEKLEEDLKNASQPKEKHTDAMNSDDRLEEDLKEFAEPQSYTARNVIKRRIHRETKRYKWMFMKDTDWKKREQKKCQQEPSWPWHVRRTVAHYDTDSQVLSMVEVWDVDEYEILKTIKFQINPSLILVHSSMPELCKTALLTKEDAEGEYEIKELREAEFTISKGKTRITSLDVTSLPQNLSAVDKMVEIATIVELDKEQMVRAAGALIGFLHSSGIVNQLEPNQPLSVSRIHYYSTSDVMSIDNSTLEGTTCCLYDLIREIALQIFSTESHPSINGAGKAKEGMSLFGIMDKTRSPVGRSMFRQWFLRPSLDVQVIQDRLNTISFFLDSDHPRDVLLEEIDSCLKRFKDLLRIVHRIRAATASINDWRNLYESMYHALRIRKLCKDVDSEVEIFRILQFPQGLVSLASDMERLIDFNESKDSMRLVVKMGVNGDLDEMKRVYAGLDDFLSQIAVEEVSNVPEEYTEGMHIVYYPQIGCQISLDSRLIPFDRMRHLSTGLIYQFHTSTRVYYKNDRTIELDRYLGDIHNDIVDAEAHITRQLEAEILKQEGLFHIVSDAMAKLDCLVSLSRCAKEYNYQRSALLASHTDIPQTGRNPVAEQCFNTFIPNDTHLSRGREGNIQVVTGPNYSGKSVYLKQTALITYMAHLGRLKRDSFVPAESARVGLCDRIFTRISSRETVSLNMSTFMIDLIQIKTMMKHSTSRSLLIIDEFGKGTSTSNGIALLAAVIRSISRRHESPRTLISTHFHQLYQRKLIQDVQWVSMDFMEEKEGTEMTYLYKWVSLTTAMTLYRIVPGVCTASYGISCAKQCGLPVSVTQRALEISEMLRKGRTPGRLFSNEESEERDRRVVERWLDLDLTTANMADFIRSLDGSQLHEE